MSIVDLAQALAEGSVGVDLALQRPGSNGRRSAVLVLISTDEKVLLLQRTATMRQHSGQVAFPGGAAEPDETPEETALRETWEEVGLSPNDVRILGRMPMLHIPVSGFDVVPVVGWWRGGAEISLQPTEVAVAHWFGLAELAEPEHRFTAVHGSFATPGFEIGRMFCWGFTAFVMDEILRAGGWELPWDATKRRPVPGSG